MNVSPNKKIRDALIRVVAAVGETQHDWPSQELRKAFDEAHDLLHPELVEERARFMRRPDQMIEFPKN